MLRRPILHLSLLIVQVVCVLPTSDFGIKTGRCTIFYLFPVQGFYFLCVLLMVIAGIEKMSFISAQLPAQIFMPSLFFFFFPPMFPVSPHWSLQRPICNEF